MIYLVCIGQSFIEFGFDESVQKGVYSFNVFNVIVYNFYSGNLVREQQLFQGGFGLIVKLGYFGENL